MGRVLSSLASTCDCLRAVIKIAKDSSNLKKILTRPCYWFLVKNTILEKTGRPFVGVLLIKILLKADFSPGAEQNFWAHR